MNARWYDDEYPHEWADVVTVEGSDHPGWHVSADEEAAMAAYTGEEWS